MMFLVAFLSIIILLALHEFGHFITAKKFGMKVEEFGIGYPPRIWGKKVGETIYSLNLLPFGAFVRLPGEIEKNDDPRAFSNQPIAKRALVVAAGVLSFWLMSTIILSVVMGLGTPMAVADEETAGLVNPHVQIVSVAKDSPAQAAGLKPGDAIKQFAPAETETVFPINKVTEFQDLTSQYKGKEVVLTMERNGETFTVSLTPRVSSSLGEGAIGIGLARVAVKSYPWWQAPWQGISATFNMTLSIIQGYGQAISNIFSGQPSGVEMIGPVGLFSLLSQAGQLGVSYFLQFIGIIAIYIAIFNILPIPSVDGGKLLFLGLEAVRRKPLKEKIEQNITTVFFSLLLLLMLFVTVKDVIKLF